MKRNSEIEMDKKSVRRFKVRIGQKWKSRDSGRIITVFTKWSQGWICHTQSGRSHHVKDITLRQFYYPVEY